MFIYIIYINFKHIKDDQNILNNSSLYRLHKRLFDGYDPWIRPVMNVHDKIEVKLDFTLLQLINMNDQVESMTVSGYLNLVWMDEFMHWEPNEEENITDIRVLVDFIWNPDIFLFNAADQSSWNQWTTSSKLY